MAYAFEEQDEDKELGGEQGKQIGAESAVISEAPKPAEQNATGSGQYVNLQSYLGANAPRQFGQEVAGRVGENVTAAEQAQEQAKTGFTSQVEQGSTRMDKEIVDRAVEAPEAVYESQPERERFTQQRTAQYKGPDQFVDSDQWQPAYSKTRSAQEEAQAGQTEGGVKSILDRYYGTGAGNYQYTPGQKNLDNLLIQGDQGARSAFDNQYSRANQVSSRFQNLENELGGLAKSKKAETEEAARYANEKVGGAKTAQRQAIENAYNQAMQQRQAAIESEKQRLSRRELSRAEAEEAGLMGDEFNAYNLNLADFMQTQADPTIHQQVNAKDRNRYTALEGLMGENQTFLPYGDLAGTYDPTKDVTFDAKRFNEQAASEQARYNDMLNKQVFGAGYAGQIDPGGSGGWIDNPIGKPGGSDKGGDRFYSTGMQGRSWDEIANYYQLNPQEISQLKQQMGHNPNSWGISNPLEGGPNSGSLKRQAEEAKKMMDMSRQSYDSLNDYYKGKFNGYEDYLSKDSFWGSYNQRGKEMSELEKFMNQKYGANNKLKIV